MSSVDAVNIAGSSLPISSKVKSLGVFFDTQLRLDIHTNEVATVCNYHARPCSTPPSICITPRRRQYHGLLAHSTACPKLCCSHRHKKALTRSVSAHNVLNSLPPRVRNSDSDSLFIFKKVITTMVYASDPSSSIIQLESFLSDIHDFMA